MEIPVKNIDNNLIINSDFEDILKQNHLLDAKKIWQIKDEPIKKILKERGTGRFFLQGAFNNKVEFFIKRYGPVPIKKRVKDLFSLKWDNFDAFNEWNAIIQFHKNQLPTLIPVLVGKWNRNSFIVTLGLKDYKRASQLLAKESGYDRARRLRLISNIAFYCAKMHKLGFAHQDLYLLHFFIKGKDDVPYLIDLQRVIYQKSLRRRWVVKDLGQLLFSCRLVMDETELTYLIDEYCREIGFDIRDDKRLFSAIEKKANKIMKRHRRLNN